MSPDRDESGPTPLPCRLGDLPLVSGPNPHEQVTQNAPLELQDQLVDLVAALPGVQVGASFRSVAGSRAFHLQPALAHGPLDAFQAGTEFAHIHPPYDGSLHLALPAPVRQRAVAAGWGVRHPESGVLLLFGPRDKDELEVAWMLLQASYRFAVGPAPGDHRRPAG